jgi:hypothetical protein
MPPTEHHETEIADLRARLARLERAANKGQRHFNQTQAARHLNRSQEWLRRLHIEKRGPKHSRRGRFYDYRLEDLEAFTSEGVTESD